MHKIISYIKVYIGVRNFFVLLVTYLAASNWYYLFSTQMLRYVSGSLDLSWYLVSGFFHFFIAISVFVGSFFVDKVNELHIIYLWAALTPVITVLVTMVSNTVFVFVFIALLAWLFGIGLLAYSVYLCSLTRIEERGRVSGIIALMSLLAYPLFSSFTKSQSSPTALSTYVLLTTSTFIIRLLKPKESTSFTASTEISSNIRHSKNALLLYMIPWVIFCLVNATAARAITIHISLQLAQYKLAQVIGYFASAFGALFGGMCADLIGRKIALSMGLISIGLSAVVSGLLSFSPLFIFVAFATSGFGWGIFLVVYFLAVWGDLSSSRNRARLYAIGLIPFYLSTGLGYLFMPQILQLPSIIAAYACALSVFLSNVSLVLAPELLPPEKKKKMEFESYKEEVKKVLKKWEDRTSKEK